MTARPADFLERCPDCGTRWLFAPRRSRDTQLPLDLSKPVVVFLDGADNTPPWGLYDEYGYRTRGAIVANPTPKEAENYPLRPREVVCWPPHRCPPKGAPAPAPAGKDAAAGE